MAAVHSNNYVGAFSDALRSYGFVQFPILNPGSLAIGEYGYMQLMQHQFKPDAKIWYVSETSKRYLPTFMTEEEI